MVKVACPACGAQFVFRSSASIFGVCAYCRTTVVRHDVNVEMLGKMAELPPDPSPLQIGTSGDYKGKSFLVVGRLKLAWSDGDWNEWYLWFSDGSAGWLAEAQGQYMLNFAVSEPPALPPAEEIRAGNTYRLGDYGEFTAEDLKNAQCVGAQGELPIDASVGRKHFNVDLSAAGNRFACLDYSAEGARMYLGHYLELAELKPIGLKNPDLEEGSAPATPPKPLSCPSCSAPLTLRAQGMSEAIACGHCGAVLDAKDENFRILSQARENLRIKPVIPLGTRGTLRGDTWDVIGFLQRSDESGLYTWREYLLLHRTKGYRWLVEQNGHWAFVRTITDRPKTVGRRAYLEGVGFAQFEQGKAVVRYVAGEFYWRVKVGETNTVADYIAPPRMLSWESADGEQVWSLGEYVEPDAIGKAFGVSPPWRSGVGACQPFPMKVSVEQLRNFWFLASFALLLVHVATASLFLPEEVTWQSRFPLADAPAPAAVPFAPVAGLPMPPPQTMPTSGDIISPAFELRHGTTNVNLELSSLADNDWMELDGELVGETNEFSEEFELGAEYYHGVDSDGSWSEGSRSGFTLLSSVPAGRYHLAFKEAGNTHGSYTVTVRRGVTMISNLFVVLLLASLFPAWVLWRSWHQELARWSNSDFTPSGGLSSEES